MLIQALIKLHEKAESHAADLRVEVRRLREHDGEQGRQLMAARRAVERLAAERTALEVRAWGHLTNTIIIEAFYCSPILTLNLLVTGECSHAELCRHILAHGNKIA